MELRGCVTEVTIRRRRDGVPHLPLSRSNTGTRGRSLRVLLPPANPHAYPFGADV
jgi:hypothetical protein